jgi:hypothetical protein
VENMAAQYDQLYRGLANEKPVDAVGELLEIGDQEASAA